MNSAIRIMIPIGFSKAPKRAVVIVLEENSITLRLASGQPAY